MVEYRPVPSYPGYLAGSDGSIIGKRGRQLTLRRAKRGYLVFEACTERYPRGKEALAHVAVCEAFHGPRPLGKEVAHENGVRTDNRAVNLAWKTHVENHADMRRHGTHREGERIEWAKLTEDAVREIRKLDHLSTVQLGKRFGVNSATVWLVRAGRTWKHVR